MGGLFAALNQYANARLHVSPRQPLNVVLTGGSKGLGKALARELLIEGDTVLITGRGEESLQSAVSQLKEELSSGIKVGPDVQQAH